MGGGGDRPALGSGVDYAHTGASVPNLGAGVPSESRETVRKGLFLRERRGAPGICARVVAGRKEPGAQQLPELLRLETAVRRHQQQRAIRPRPSLAGEGESSRKWCGVDCLETFFSREPPDAPPEPFELNA